jgi:hypothetical protein
MQGTPKVNDQNRLFVFSHPNHELAVFGYVQRLRPRLLFLTDGGGPERLAETRAGLESIGLLHNARFLDHTEAAFYDALVEGNIAFFQSVSAEIRDEIDRVTPDEVYYDAVEFYNPVHDMSTPLVRRALPSSFKGREYEVPLVYQQEGPGESYEIQRFPRSQQRDEVSIRLTDGELEAKVSARDRIYSQLRQQMGPLIGRLPLEHLKSEVVARTLDSLPTPDATRTLRYEWRGQLLKARGEVDNVITYVHHYLPIAMGLGARAFA